MYLSPQHRRYVIAGCLCPGQVGGRSGFQGNRLRSSSILMACTTFGCLISHEMIVRVVCATIARPRER
jgi:hypothetical protein